MGDNSYSTTDQMLHKYYDAFYMKKISVLTATRAEYGLLSPVIKKLMKEPGLDVRVVVTGMHLSPEFGLTYREIEEDGVPIDRKIEMLLSADTPVAVTKSMGVAMIGFADYFSELKPDALLVLGDRYETLSVCMAAMNERIPIFHIHGGEITEGAIDDAIRHCITKLSYLHFTSTEVYRKRVIQLGEEPGRVFNVGALGVENAKNSGMLSREELETSIDWELGDKFAVLTFHPVTLEKNTAEEQITELLIALNNFPDINFIATKANSDTGGRIINEKLGKYASENKHLRCFDSLGMKRYLSAIKNAEFVIGNSSSGIIEAPAFGIPTINIGDRQKGRIRGRSIIDCIAERKSIICAINKALSSELKETCRTEESPYGKGNTSDIIVSVLRKYFNEPSTDIKKTFFDITGDIADYE